MHKTYLGRIVTEDMVHNHVFGGDVLNQLNLETYELSQTQLAYRKLHSVQEVKLEKSELKLKKRELNKSHGSVK